jgi:hypothetical protein
LVSYPCPGGRLAGSKCVSRSHASFDDLIGALQHRLRHAEPQRLRGFEVDHQLEFARLLDRQIGRPLAFEEDTGLADQAGIARSIAEQAAGYGVFTPWIDRQDGMSRRQRHQLFAGSEERIGADQERTGTQLDARGEGRVDLAFPAGLQDMELQTLGACRFPRLSRKALVSRIGRVHQQGDDPCLGRQLGQQFEPLGCQLVGDVADARNIAAQPGETGDQAGRDRVADAREDDRDRRGCVFRNNGRVRNRAADAALEGQSPGFAGRDRGAIRSSS